MYRTIEEELLLLEGFLSESELLDRCAGMSAQQVEELVRDPLFWIGVHTVDHLFLTRCEGDEVERQIVDNTAWLERACKWKCDAIAYPLDDCDARILRRCREAGLAHGYAVDPWLKADLRFEVLHIGIYPPVIGLSKYLQDVFTMMPSHIYDPLAELLGDTESFG